MLFTTERREAGHATFRDIWTTRERKEQDIGKIVSYFYQWNNHPRLASSKEIRQEKILGHLWKQPQGPRCRENKAGGIKPVIIKAHLYLNSSYCFLSKTRCFIQCFESHRKEEHVRNRGFLYQGSRNSSGSYSEIFKYLITVSFSFFAFFFLSTKTNDLSV